jgi:hypothetical protein
MKIRIFLVGLVFITGLGLNAQVNKTSMEVMYIYNFLKYIHWPSNSVGSNFVIGVYGSSEVYNALASYTQNRKVGSKTIRVVRITKIEDSSTCQVLYVSATESVKISQFSKYLSQKSCLIISQKEGTNAMGSAIEFVSKGNKINFRISEETAKRHRLIISSTLLDMSV